ncbi:hypothetical protein [Ancylobacter vacuolatus]|uniref:Replication initiation protein n=1 Tax=Ancylobacter vacuolatus TaxID=223389 RepID=A0ABU0DMY7_9HYPH|nr:hypothetical protein [Ancylobacter vacuolatus]MDQ0349817.1 hypothetical protein [Ancylobacter vacuolatus]
MRRDRSSKPRRSTTFHRFETREKVLREDKKRARLLRKTAANIPVSGNVPVLSGARELRRLAARLERVQEGRIPRTLASSRKMRRVRRKVFRAIMQEFEVFEDEEVRTFTVISRSWCIDPERLQILTAKHLKRQFLSHLERSGISSIEGCLVAFIHGEFEPTSGLFQLHLHGMGTRKKVRALHRLKGNWGYLKTVTGSHPIRVEMVRNRAAQVSYLLKSYWPSRAVREVDGVQRRNRDKRRIPEPYHSEVLCWFHRQTLGDMTIVQGGRFLPNGELRLSCPVVDDADSDF